MTKATFHSLPNELVLQIVSDVDDSSLLSLSLCNSGLSNLLTGVLRTRAFAPRGDLSAIQWAAVRDYTPLVKLLLAGGMHPDTGATVIVPAALFTAVRDRYFDIVKLLLFHGADVNYHNFDYHCGFEDAIHVAAANGDAQMITLLAVYRADLESVMPENVYGGTPLQIAAPRGHVRAVKALLKLGAYVDQGDAFGATALEKVESMAVQVRYESDMWESMIEIAEILVKAGAYVSHTKRSVAQMCACPNLRVAGEFQGILLALKMRLVDGGM